MSDVETQGTDVETIRKLYAQERETNMLLVKKVDTLQRENAKLLKELHHYTQINPLPPAIYEELRGCRIEQEAQWEAEKYRIIEGGAYL